MSSQTKSSGVKLPEGHGVSKNLDPNNLPEKQNIRPLKGNEILQEKPQVSQGQAGVRRGRPPPINQTITQTSEMSQRIPEGSKIEIRITNQTESTTPAQSITNSNVEVTHRRPLIKHIPFYTDSTYRPSPKPVKTSTTKSSKSSESPDIIPEINIDFEENPPFQEGVISEMYQRPNKSFFQEPQESNLIQKCLTKQADIIKILNIIQRKVLKGTHLAVAIKEIQAGYLISLYFKDIYLYSSTE